MNFTLSQLLGRRMWLVSGVVVWGDMMNFEPEMILTETDGAVKRILHGRFTISGSTQVINFADLADHRGNKLPAGIANPVVLPILRGDTSVIVQGSVTSDSFRLAQIGRSNKAVITDLLILEMGA